MTPNLKFDPKLPQISNLAPNPFSLKNNVKMVSAGGGAENEDENIEGKRSIEYFLFFR